MQNLASALACSIDWRLILDYLKVLLSGPPVTAVVVFFVGWRFQSSIRQWFNNRTLDRLEASATGISATFTNQTPDARAPEPKIVAQIEAPPPVPALTPLPPDPSGALKDGVPYITKESLREDLRDDPRALGLLQYLQSNFASSIGEIFDLALWYRFEEALHMIFGTQTEVLLALVTDDEWLSQGALKLLYTKHRQLVGEANPRPEDAFYEFLVTKGFIEKRDRDSETEYRIHPDGRSYLAYVQRKYPLKWNQNPL